MRDHGVGRRSQSCWAAVVLLFPLLFSCNGGGEQVRRAAAAAPVPLGHGVHFEAPFLVVPDQSWSPHPTGEGWRFRTYAGLVFVVGDDLQGAIRLRLVPRPETARFHFALRWDDAELLPTPVMLPEAGLEIELTPEHLTPGRHELIVQRLYRYDDLEDRKRYDNDLLAITCNHGGQTVAIVPQEEARYRRIADFVQRGGLGVENERRGGHLFVGPAAHAIPLSLSADATLRVEPENHSPKAARFRASWQGEEAATTVPPGERGALDLALAAGEGEMRLEVEGEEGGVFLWGMPVVDTGAPAALPPIVLITLDTTRRDVLGPYRDAHGSEDMGTPHLDDLSARSTVFENAYSTAPWTLPSHASIFTGRYPSRHGAGVSRPQLPPSLPTLAGLLRAQGYLTAGFSAGELSSSRFGLGLGFDYYRNPDQFETKGGRQAEHVEAFLERVGSQPLFLFINYFDPHALFDAPARFQERFAVAEHAAAIRQLPIWSRLVENDVGAWKAVIQGKAAATPEALAYLRAAYQAEVAYADHLLGRLFARLEEDDLFDRALIIVTADHGELLGEGGYYSHSARLDPELMEIPLIIKWPGQSTAHRVDSLVSLVDLFPTVLTVAGIEAPPHDGVLLDPRAPAPSRPYIFLEEHEFVVHPLDPYMRVAPRLYGVQKPSFRQLVWRQGTACARREEHLWHEVGCAADGAEVLRGVQQMLAPPAAGVPMEGPVPEEMRESLEALGYL